jgi:hypothetical protein
MQITRRQDVISVCLAPLHYAASKLSSLKTTEGFIDAGTESFVFTGRADYIHSHALEDRSADLLITNLRVVTRWLVLFFLLKVFNPVRQVKHGTDQGQYALQVGICRHRPQFVQM